MKNKLRKLIPFISLAIFTMALVLPLAVFFAPHIAHAADAPTGQTVEASILGNIVVKGISYIVQMLISLFGKLAIQLIHILILVAGYNSYMTAPAITTGWVILRDMANLFFVALILVVSIGSIVNPERFKGPQQVFRILLFALLVNFSRTIAGLFIDISQVVMLTFVNGFAQAAGGNFVEALGVTKLTDFPQVGGAIGVGETIASLFLALLMFVIITVIIGVMVVALVVRMVTLWLLVVTSPIAFATGASSFTKKYYDEWWKKFSAELTTGPMVAFFLWLSLVSFQQSSTGTELTGESLKSTSGGTTEQSSLSCGATTACTEENMIRFIIATVMLLTGLGFAKEFSGVGGDLAKGALSKGKAYAKTATYWAAKKSAPAAVGYGLAGPIGGGIALAASTTRGKAFLGRSLAGGNAIGNKLNWIPGVSRVGLALTASAKKDNEAKQKKADEKIKIANPGQLVGMARGIGFDKTTQMAAKVALAGKSNKDSGWDDNTKRKELAAAEAFYKSTSNKSGLDEIEKLKKKNPLLIDENEKVKDSNDKVVLRPDGAPLTKREQFVQKMSGNELLELSPDALKTVASFLTPNQREHVKKNGGGERENIVTDWENKELKADAVGNDLRSGKLSVDNISDKLLIRPDIAVRISADDLQGKFKELMKTPAKKEAVKKGTQEVLSNFDKSASGRLATGGKTYSDEAQKAAEGHVRAGGTIGVAFNINDATGKFKNAASTPAGVADEAAFEKAIKGDSANDILLNIDAAAIEDVKSDIRKTIARELDVKDLFELRDAAKGDNKKKRAFEAIARTMLEKYIGDGDRTEVINKKFNIY